MRKANAACQQRGGHLSGQLSEADTPLTFLAGRIIAQIFNFFLALSSFTCVTHVLGTALRLFFCIFSFSMPAGVCQKGVGLVYIHPFISLRHELLGARKGPTGRAKKTNPAASAVCSIA